jgi:hypothetical protein
MTLNVTKALEAFNLADYVDIDCGSFEIRIAQAAVHNEAFRAAVASRSMRAKRRSVVPEKGSLTGSFEEDVELFLDVVIQGWGETKPLKDDDGKAVKYTKDVGRELFTSSKQGRVLFGKIMRAAVDDETFSVSEEDRKN